MISDDILAYSKTKGQGSSCRWLLQSDIDACTDAAALKAWYLDLEESKDIIKAQVEARIATETDDDDWAVRVSYMLASIGVGMARVKRRAKGLDYDVTGETGRLGKRLHQREQEIAEYKRRLSRYEDITILSKLDAA